MDFGIYVSHQTPDLPPQRLLCSLHPPAGVAYEIDFGKKSSIDRKIVIVPVPDRGFLKSSWALLEPTWTRILRRRHWDTSRTPKSSQKIDKSETSGIKLPIYRASG